MHPARQRLAAAAVLALACLAPRAAPATELASRQAALERFAARFQTELYPLFSRSVNGCRTCHHPDAPQAFRVLQSPVATFSLLLEGNLLAADNPMAVPGRVSSHDERLRMPQAGHLAPAEVQAIVAFSNDLSEALSEPDAGSSAPPDERFPDSLLLPYDGTDRKERVPRRLSYYQLRRSFATIFGPAWLAESGLDPFRNRASAFGGADFRASFETSRTVSASYLTALQAVAREVARRYVSAPRQDLFEGFDPDLYASEARRPATRNVQVLYENLLFRRPTAAESERALTLVRELQLLPVSERKVAFTLEASDPAGRRARQRIDVTLREADAQVSRFLLDQAQPAGDAGGWVRVGTEPFRFEAGNPGHFVRLVAKPGNHVTVFDALKLVRMAGGRESAQEVVLDNLDPECVVDGAWEPVAKDGELSRAGGPKKKYEQPLEVVGSNHLESRFLDSELRSATMALRIPTDGRYNVYLSWPAIPHAAQAALVEVHSANHPPAPVPPTNRPQARLGLASAFLDQTESTLDEDGETQWQRLPGEFLLADEGHYLEISNRGVDSTAKVIVADAARFTPLGGGPAIVVDNASEEGFERSEGWAPDQLARGAPGRGKMHGDDILHYPPSRSGDPLDDYEVDPDRLVWARFRPVLEGRYRPGWYTVSVWAPGGHTHADWVAHDIRAGAYSPIVAVEPAPTFLAGEIATLDGTATHHPGGEAIAYRWTHSAHDLGLRLDRADTPHPRFVVPPIRSPRPGWAGLIEALLQRPEFLLPPDTPEGAPHARLVRVALDLVGRVPTQQELRLFDRLGRLAPLVDAYLDSADFRDFFFHRARATLRSRGTEASDEPARLWTHLAVNDRSYRELFTADYSVTPAWSQVSRRPEHGPTGILTMPGYLEGKPGLPKFTYPAQVLTFALGIQFEVSDAVEQAREKVVSTTDPASMCYACHKLLTPLAYQRERWDVHGHYRTVDEAHNVIDDSDRGVVPDYPFAGNGLSAFARQVVRKERFVRAFVNLHHDLLFHRQLRVLEDQRDEYKELHDFAVANDLKIRPLLKRMVLMRYGEHSG